MNSVDQIAFIAGATVEDSWLLGAGQGHAQPAWRVAHWPEQHSLHAVVCTSTGNDSPVAINEPQKLGGGK